MASVAFNGSFSKTMEEVENSYPIYDFSMSGTVSANLIKEISKLKNEIYSDIYLTNSYAVDNSFHTPQKVNNHIDVSATLEFHKTSLPAISLANPVQQLYKSVEYQGLASETSPELYLNISKKSPYIDLMTQSDRDFKRYENYSTYTDLHPCLYNKEPGNLNFKEKPETANSQEIASTLLTSLPYNEETFKKKHLDHNLEKLKTVGSSEKIEDNSQFSLRSSSHSHFHSEDLLKYLVPQTPNGNSNVFTNLDVKLESNTPKQYFFENTYKKESEYSPDVNEENFSTSFIQKHEFKYSSLIAEGSKDDESSFTHNSSSTISPLHSQGLENYKPNEIFEKLENQIILDNLSGFSFKNADSDKLNHSLSGGFRNQTLGHFTEQEPKDFTSLCIGKDYEHGYSSNDFIFQIDHLRIATINNTREGEQERNGTKGASIADFDFKQFALISQPDQPQNQIDPQIFKELKHNNTITFESKPKEELSHSINNSHIFYADQQHLAIQSSEEQEKIQYFGNSQVLGMEFIPPPNSRLDNFTIPLDENKKYFVSENFHELKNDLNPKSNLISELGYQPYFLSEADQAELKTDKQIKIEVSQRLDEPIDSQQASFRFPDSNIEITLNQSTPMIKAEPPALEGLETVLSPNSVLISGTSPEAEGFRQFQNKLEEKIINTLSEPTKMPEDQQGQSFFEFKEGKFLPCFENKSNHENFINTSQIQGSSKISRPNRKKFHSFQPPINNSFSSSENFVRSLSLTNNFENNKFQETLNIFDFLSEIKATEHEDGNCLFSLAGQYLEARKFLGSNESAFLVFSFHFYENILLRNFSIEKLETVQLIIEDIRVSQIIRANGITQNLDLRFLDEFNSFMENKKIEQGTSLFESICNQFRAFETAQYLFKKILVEYLKHTGLEIDFFSSSSDQNFLWINENLGMNGKIQNKIAKLLNATVKILHLNHNKLVQQTLTCSDIDDNNGFNKLFSSNSVMTIFYDQRNETSYLLYEIPRVENKIDMSEKIQNDNPNENEQVFVNLSYTEVKPLPISHSILGFFEHVPLKTDIIFEQSEEKELKTKETLDKYNDTISIEKSLEDFLTNQGLKNVSYQEKVYQSSPNPDFSKLDPPDYGMKLSKGQFSPVGLIQDNHHLLEEKNDNSENLSKKINMNAQSIQLQEKNIFVDMESINKTNDIIKSYDNLERSREYQGEKSSILDVTLAFKELTHDDILQKLKLENIILETHEKDFNETIKKYLDEKPWDQFSKQETQELRELFEGHANFIRKENVEKDEIRVIGKKAKDDLLEYEKLREEITQLLESVSQKDTSKDDFIVYQQDLEKKSEISQSFPLPDSQAISDSKNTDQINEEFSSSENCSQSYELKETPLPYLSMFQNKNAFETLNQETDLKKESVLCSEICLVPKNIEDPLKINPVSQNAFEYINSNLSDKLQERNLKDVESILDENSFKEGQGNSIERSLTQDNQNPFTIEGEKRILTTQSSLTIKTSLDIMREKMNISDQELNNHEQEFQNVARKYLVDAKFNETFKISFNRLEPLIGKYNEVRQRKLAKNTLYENLSYFKENREEKMEFSNGTKCHNTGNDLSNFNIRNSSGEEDENYHFKHQPCPLLDITSPSNKYDFMNLGKDFDNLRNKDYLFNNEDFGSISHSAASSPHSLPKRMNLKKPNSTEVIVEPPDLFAEVFQVKEANNQILKDKQMFEISFEPTKDISPSYSSSSFKIKTGYERLKEKMIIQDSELKIYEQEFNEKIANYLKNDNLNPKNSMGRFLLVVDKFKKILIQKKAKIDKNYVNQNINTTTEDDKINKEQFEQFNISKVPFDGILSPRTEIVSIEVTREVPSDKELALKGEISPPFHTAQSSKDPFEISEILPLVNCPFTKSEAFPNQDNLENLNFTTHKRENSNEIQYQNSSYIPNFSNELSVKKEI